MAMAWAHLTSSGVQNGVRGWRLEWRGVRSSSASSELPGGRERGRDTPMLQTCQNTMAWLIPENKSSLKGGLGHTVQWR